MDVLLLMRLWTASLVHTPLLRTLHASLPESPWPIAPRLLLHPPPRTQVFTAVEDFGLTCLKLSELGFKVNAEDSELVYRVRQVGGGPRTLKRTRVNECHA